MLFRSGFCVGGLSHVLADACTVSGVPALPWSTRRFHLLGGKLRTGGPGELVLAAAVLSVGIAVSFYTGSVSKIGGYIPFFRFCDCVMWFCDAIFGAIV